MLSASLNDVFPSFLSCFAFPAGCAVVRPWEAAIIGSTGAVVSLSASRLMVHFKIDDPVDAVAVHGASGVWVSVNRHKQPVQCIGRVGKY